MESDRTSSVRRAGISTAGGIRSTEETVERQILSSHSQESYAFTQYAPVAHNHIFGNALVPPPPLHPTLLPFPAMETPILGPLQTDQWNAYTLNWAVSDSVSPSSSSRNYVLPLPILPPSSQFPPSQGTSASPPRLPHKNTYPFDSEFPPPHHFISLPHFTTDPPTLPSYPPPPLGYYYVPPSWHTPYPPPPPQVPQMYHPVPPIRPRVYHRVQPIRPPVEDIRAKIIKQLDYYFSADNLSRDSHLRRMMDNEGWVKLADIMPFPMITLLTDANQVVLEAARASSIIEVQGENMRRKGDWMRWPSLAN